ncbi:unnamed protein product [Effrenium voratum]|nr:unnamed protein product [Effrenium voratum]
MRTAPVKVACQDSSAPPPGVMNGLDVHAGPMPNGQGEHDGQPAPRELAVDTEPEEAFDSFDPGSPTAPRGAETQGTSQSNGAWASFSEPASAPPGLAFAAFDDAPPWPELGTQAALAPFLGLVL